MHCNADLNSLWLQTGQILFICESILFKFYFQKAVKNIQLPMSVFVLTSSNFIKCKDTWFCAIGAIQACFFIFKQSNEKKPDSKNLISQNKPSNIPIGIITLYKSQKELIENMINQTDWLSSIRDLIKVDTVDSYQGQENDIIILSLVRDNHQGIEGFLLNPERINVSLSRAKERLIIIGASKMWSENNIDSPLNKVFNEIYQNAIIDPCNFKLIQSNKW